MAHIVAKESGTPITPEMIEALAAEAEAGYDLTRATEVRVGRPALGDDATPSPRISFRAPAYLYRALHERASAEGRSVSDLAREAVERYING
jgi:hypothetical protein